MQFKNRYIQLTVALAIVGIVSAQVPTGSSVALAADGYPDNNDTNGGTFSFKGGNGAILTGVLVGAGYAAIGGGNAGGSAIGAGDDGRIKGSIFNNKAIYDLTSDKPDQFTTIRQIIQNAGMETFYRDMKLGSQPEGPYTVFWPTDSALAQIQNASKLTQLQNRDMAKEFLKSITFKGTYNLKSLKSGTLQLTNLLGEMSLTSTGAVGGVTLGTEDYPASNGWVIPVNGVVSDFFVRRASF